MKKAESKTCDKYKVDFKNNTNKAVILNVNELLKKYIHDIRNINVLDEEMLNNISEKDLAIRPCWRRALRHGERSDQKLKFNI